MPGCQSARKMGKGFQKGATSLHAEVGKILLHNKVVMSVMSMYVQRGRLRLLE